MKVYVFITLLIGVHLASSTITLDKIGEKVHAGLKLLKEKAVTKFHKLKEEIELKKLHQLHASHFLPYAHHKHYVQEHYSKKTPLIVDPHQIHRLQHYFEPHHHKIHHIPPPPIHHIPPPPVHHIHGYHHVKHH